MRTKDLSNLSLRDLQQEINTRQQTVQELYDERNDLLSRLSELDEQIFKLTEQKPDHSGFTSTTTKRHRQRRRRPENTMTLVDTLKEVLTDKTLSVSEATSAVKEQGYKSNAKNFKLVVNQTLTRFPDLFTKVERGFYTHTPSNGAVKSSKKKTNPKRKVTDDASSKA